MKILVPLKRVADPDNANKIRIAPGGSRITTEGLEPKPNPFDEYAVETALRLTENGKARIPGDQVVVASFGPKEAAAILRQALAMGADSALLYLADDEGLSGDVVARALAKVVGTVQPDLVVLGKQTVDGESNQVGQMLGTILGWPCATFAMTIELAADKKSVVVGREVDGGIVRVRLALPAVVTVDLRIITPRAVVNHVTPATFTYAEGPRYAALPMIIKAKTKPLAEAPLASLGIDAQPRVQYRSFAMPAARKAGIKVQDVPELVRQLRTGAKAL